MLKEEGGGLRKKGNVLGRRGRVNEAGRGLWRKGEK